MEKENKMDELNGPDEPSIHVFSKKKMNRATDAIVVKAKNV